MMRTSFCWWPAIAAGAILAGPAAGQVAPETIPAIRPTAPTPTPSPAATAAPVPIVTPTPAAPPAPVVTVTPRPTPTARPTPRPTSEATPRAEATPRPRATATPAPQPSAAPAVAPSPAVPSPAATAAPTPQPTATPTPAVAPPGDDGGLPFWAIPAVLLALGAIAAAILAWRRRAAAHEQVHEAEVMPAPATIAPAAPTPSPPAPEPAAAPAAPAPRFLDPVAPPPTPLARIDIDEPAVTRAGINLVTATADITVVVHNRSDVPASRVALEVRLTSAQPGQDAAIAEMFAAPVAKPTTPPFDLAPGESRRVRTLATLPRDDITVLQAGGRPMFVPVIAIRAAHEGGQTVSIHAIGVERPGQVKLGPFWLDQPTRMYDAIGVRPHNPQ